MVVAWYLSAETSFFSESEMLFSLNSYSLAFFLAKSSRGGGTSGSPSSRVS